MLLFHTLHSCFQTAGSELERAVTRYSRCRRKDPEHERREANEDVYVSKKKFHQVYIDEFPGLRLNWRGDFWHNTTFLYLTLH